MTNADMTTKGLGLRYAKVEVLHKQTNMKHVQLMVLILVS